jgi:hypothetical protein
MSRARVQAEFIITGVVNADGEKEVRNIDELNEALAGRIGSVRLVGIYPGSGETYTYPLNLGQ